MPSGAKAIIIITSVLTALIITVICVIIFTSQSKDNQNANTGLSSNTTAIEMRNEGALSKRHFVDRAMSVRIRLPNNMTQIQQNIVHQSGVRSSFVAMDSSRNNIVVLQFSRSDGSFDTFVRTNREDIIRNGASNQNATLVSEGRSTIGGLNAYSLFTDSSKGNMMAKMWHVIVDGPDDSIYWLTATALENNWEGFKSIAESSMSTFEIGKFAEDPPDLPGRGVVGPVTPGNPTPPPPRFHTTFADVPEALTYLQTGQDQERRAAMSYVERAKPDPAQHDKVLAALEKLLEDNALRDGAANALKTWATKSDAPLLRGVLERMLQKDPNASSLDGMNTRKTIIQLLGQFGDGASAKSLVQCLKSMFYRSDAQTALQALGAAAEPALLEILDTLDSAQTREVLTILEKVGTEKSILPLQRLAGGKATEQTKLATDTLNKIADRLKLKPEQYVYNLINHYEFTTPTGFNEELSKMPNTRQWTRIATGRTVPSVLTVTVKLVPKDYKIQIPPNVTVTMDVGTIKFNRITPMATTNPVQYAALDSEYLIEFTINKDPEDGMASPSITSALKKMRPVTNP